ncbi:SRPBCC domain-containing protein [Streptomyces sp. NPDC050658]|uniref:SRPBCC domain-containing protein n=1 Tax=unclassified Streptomyces TaxID=2593676 RepID=UPI00343D4447
MYATRVSRHVNAPRPAVYRALVDAEAIARWRVPTGMTGHVHVFEAREGGEFRVSLTYDASDDASYGAGKSSSHTDTYQGRFARLVPDREVVEVFAFETADAELRGTMTMTTTLTDGPDGGTDVLIVHEGLPDAIPAADNETGTRMALAHLARLVEGGELP